MRGVSYVIAIILVLMIAVAIAALGYVWIMATQTGLQETGGEAIQSTTTTFGTSFNFEGLDDNRIFIRNTGTSNLTQMALYIDEMPINITKITVGGLESDTIPPGTTGTLHFDAAGFPQLRDFNMKITSGEGASLIRIQKAFWSEDFQITTNKKYYWTDAVTLDNDEIWAVWRDYLADIWYMRSTDNGVSWGSPTRLTSTANLEDYPTILQSQDGKLWIYYLDSTIGKIKFKTTDDYGDTWDDGETNIGYVNYIQAIQASNTTFWIVYNKYLAGTYSIYSRTSPDGITWSEEQKVSGANWSFIPDIAEYSNDIWVSWYRLPDYGGEYRVYDQSADTWGSIIDFGSKRYFLSFFPLSDEKLIIFYFDGDDYKSYYRILEDGEWSGDIVIMNTYPMYRFSSVEAPNGNRVLLWSQYVSGYFDIFYKYRSLT